MSTFQERLLQERHDLDDKIEKLRAFIWDKNPIYKTLPEVSTSLLHNQLHVMRQYSDILKHRSELIK